jgi:hypothetical protein
MVATLIASTKNTARVVREYSSHPQVENLGVMENEVRLYSYNDGRLLAVEWDAGDLDTVCIGIWTSTHNHKKVVDYDGVFSLPREIAAFLKEQGFDLSDVTA